MSDIDENQNTMTMFEARLLDLRTYIALLFYIFGVVVTTMGLFATDDQLEKAVGVNINLWSGLGMIGIAVFFTVWILRNPPVPLGVEPNAKD